MSDERYDFAAGESAARGLPEPPPDRPAAAPPAAEGRLVDDVALLLDELTAFIRRFVICTDAHACVLALWITHTHAIDAAETTPYLAVTSPEKGCGKSRLFDVLELLVARPWKVATPSEAVTFRKIAAEQPTLLLDEVDAVFGAKAANGNHEGLRALLNAGNRRGTFVPRCVGQGHALENFPVFCAKALAGIGDCLPDTVADRSLPIRLKRRAASEQVERFRVRRAEADAAPLRERAERWGEANVDALADAEPTLPDELSDRAMDAVEPLVAIADAAGGDWPTRARRAIVELLGGARRDDDSLGVRLLADARAVFDERNEERLSSGELAEALAANDEAPWGDMRGKALDARGLARLLKRYEIRPGTVRLSSGETAKGYKREDFEDAWGRYLPSQASRPSQRLNHAGFKPFSDPSHDVDVTDAKVAAIPHEQRDVTDVTPERADTAPRRELSRQERDELRREIARRQRAAVGLPPADGAAT